MLLLAAACVVRCPHGGAFLVRASPTEARAGPRLASPLTRARARAQQALHPPERHVTRPESPRAPSPSPPSFFLTSVYHAQQQRSSSLYQALRIEQGPVQIEDDEQRLLSHDLGPRLLHPRLVLALEPRRLLRGGQQGRVHRRKRRRMGPGARRGRGWSRRGCRRHILGRNDEFL
jgi:hypothetical protein